MKYRQSFNDPNVSLFFLCLCVLKQLPFFCAFNASKSKTSGILSSPIRPRTIINHNGQMFAQESPVPRASIGTNLTQTSNGTFT